MKTYAALSSSLMFLTIWSCSSQTHILPHTLEKITEEKHFSFKAQRAHPTNQDVRAVMNTHPTHSSARLYELNTETYGMDVKEKEITVYLPYYGRRFAATMDPNDNGLNFTSNHYLYDKKTTKKGGYIITITPKDAKAVQKIFIEISKNGSAYLSVQANDRTPISYSGYITEMKSETK